MKNSIRQRITACLVTALILVTAACGTSKSSTHTSDTTADTAFSITDSFGKKVDFKEKPKRVCLLSATLLSVWYDVGGTAVCTPSFTGNEKFPPKIATKVKDVPKVGMIWSVNMEQVLAANPDLVIAAGAVSAPVTEKISAQGIPVLNIKTRSLQELQTAYKDFGILVGQPEQAAKRSMKIGSQVNGIVKKMPNDHTRVAILYTTASSTALKLDNSISGSMAKLLHMENIASTAVPDNPNAETTTLNVEKIAKEQPDYLMVTSMVMTNAQGRQLADKELRSNPAWQTVDAVRKNKIIYLPHQYFLFNAGPQYADSVKYMAASVHPEIFGKPVEP